MKVFCNKYSEDSVDPAAGLKIQMFPIIIQFMPNFWKGVRNDMKNFSQPMFNKRCVIIHSVIHCPAVGMEIFLIIFQDLTINSIFYLRKFITEGITKTSFFINVIFKNGFGAPIRSRSTIRSILSISVASPSWHQGPTYCVKTVMGGYKGSYLGC